MMVSLCTKYYQFILAQSISRATGVSILFFTGVTAASTWFLRHRALALGIVVAGSSIGGIIFRIIVSRLNQSVGFPWAIRTCAFLILALCIVANLTVKRGWSTPRSPRMCLTTFDRYATGSTAYSFLRTSNSTWVSLPLKILSSSKRSSMGWMRV